MDKLSQMPEPPSRACYGSDGGWLSVAGVWNATGHRQQAVWVLDGLESSWIITAAELPAPRSSPVGLLLGDLLECIGGFGYEVRGCLG